MTLEDVEDGRKIVERLLDIAARSFFKEVGPQAGRLSLTEMDIPRQMKDHVLMAASAVPQAEMPDADEGRF